METRTVWTGAFACPSTAADRAAERYGAVTIAPYDDEKRRARGRSLSRSQTARLVWTTHSHVGLECSSSTDPGPTVSLSSLHDSRADEGADRVPDVRRRSMRQGGRSDEVLRLAVRCFTSRRCRALRRGRGGPRGNRQSCEVLAGLPGRVVLASSRRSRRPLTCRRQTAARRAAAGFSRVGAKDPTRRS
jgi:hypothetical protein